MNRRYFSATFAAAALAFSLGMPARAADDLPKAETIIDRYIEVTGGRAAYEKLHSEIEVGSMTINGITGTATTYKLAPDKTLTEIEFQGLGKMRDGSNGTVAWSSSAIQGPHVKDGEEKETSLMMAKFDGELNWRSLYTKTETVGVENVAGKDCYKVVMTPKAGKPMTRFYDKDSGLLLKTVITTKSAMGEITVESMLEDYRKEGDILRPHKTTNNAMGQKFSITVDKVQYNPDIPASKFDVPEEIQALLNKDKK